MDGPPKPGVAERSVGRPVQRTRYGRRRGLTPVRNSTARRSPLVEPLRAFTISGSPIAAAATAIPSPGPDIESWFGKLKEREVWLNEDETLELARLAIGAYVERYHDRPHSGLGDRTPNEVARAWEEGHGVQTSAA